MTRKRKLIWLSLAALPLAVVLTALFWPRTSALPPQIITMPDGQKYQFAGVTYGTNHVLGSATAKIVHWLPAPLAGMARKILGARLTRVDGARTTAQPSLCVWFLPLTTNAPAPFTGPASQVYARLADDKGVEAGSQARIWFWGTGQSCVEYPVLPRRSRMLQLYFYRANLMQEVEAEIGRFKFPNPVYGKYPQWQPDPGPNVRKAGDLEVRLDKFLVGRRLVGPLITIANGQMASDYGPVHKGDRAETVFDISLNSPGGSNGSWLLQNAALSDATGNALDNSLTSMGAVSDRGSSGLSPMDGHVNSRRTLPGALWPDESAWKLRLEFKRITGFDTNELVTFKNVPAPAPGTSNQPGLRLRVGDTEVTLAAFGRERAPDAAELEASRRGGSPPIFNSLMSTLLGFEITGRRDGLAVDFVRMTIATQWSDDEAWAKLDGPGSEPHLTFNSWQPGVRVIGLSALSTNAQTVDITLSVQKTRSVEFLLKPPK